MPEVQDTDDIATAVNDFFPPVTATTHIRVTTDTTPIVPQRRSIWPLAPWRWVLIVTAIGLSIPCGIAAAAPVWNGAELSILIILAIFVAAFTPGRDS
ncbi:hypothetical protein [Microbacterium aurantiacum]|uniref:hypothetical protein n=1 Tax=Microbacterium aurantiacum TaxID=162393 RepID=UPI0011AF6C4C|nr:hypothetical protein [Microbacterium aurantiacum]